MLRTHVRSGRRCGGFSGSGLSRTSRSAARAASTVGCTPRSAGPRRKYPATGGRARKGPRCEAPCGPPATGSRGNRGRTRSRTASRKARRRFARPSRSARAHRRRSLRAERPGRSRTFRAHSNEGSPKRPAPYSVSRSERCSGSRTPIRSSRRDSENAIPTRPRPCRRSAAPPGSRSFATSGSLIYQSAGQPSPGTIQAGCEIHRLGPGAPATRGSRANRSNHREIGFAEAAMRRSYGMLHDRCQRRASRRHPRARQTSHLVTAEAHLLGPGARSSSQRAPALRRADAPPSAHERIRAEAGVKRAA